MNVVTTILNSIADYGDCCGIEKLAEQFRTTPGRLSSTLKKLERDGLIRIKGRLYPTVYPTVKMLRQQNADLSEAEAAKIIRRIERA